jgi:hypothetical protein
VRRGAGAQKAVDQGTPAPAVVAVNAAAISFVDELLRLPSPSAAATVVTLLYGPGHQVPPAVLSHVNGGIHVPLAPLLASPSPLAIPLPDRLRVSSAWRVDSQALKGARAAARDRYRELQAAFVASTPPAPRDPAAALIRYTYGCDGRQWLWEEAAGRVLHRVAVLNRAVLDLLAISGGESPTDGLADLPASVLDLMAASLPPVAVPDWARFAGAMEDSRAVMHDDEAVQRYRSLLAEILGRHTDGTASS